MRINPFTSIAKSSIGQNIYSKMLNPSKEKFWNNTLPLIETSVASCLYMMSAQVQRDIDPKSKQAIQWQNFLSWVVSIGMSIPLNKKIGKFGENIIKELEKIDSKAHIKDIHKLTNGIKVGIPLVVVTLLNRYIIPSILVPISSVLRDKTIKK